MRVGARLTDTSAKPASCIIRRASSELHCHWPNASISPDRSGRQSETVGAGRASCESRTSRRPVVRSPGARLSPRVGTQRLGRTTRSCRLGRDDRADHRPSITVVFRVVGGRDVVASVGTGSLEADVPLDAAGTDLAEARAERALEPRVLVAVRRSDVDVVAGPNCPYRDERTKRPVRSYRRGPDPPSPMRGRACARRSVE